MRGVNTASARGACGFTMTEVQQVPSVLLEWLFRLYELAESTGIWPSQCTKARVVMLGKPDCKSDDPLGIRPITVLPVLYRVWSRHRSLQLMTYLGGFIPPEIGNVACRTSSDLLATWVSDLIDHGISEGIGRCGLVIDLTKCFNLLPRKPLMRLMQCLGIPDQYLIAHQGMLRSMERYLEISGRIGRGGCP